MRVRLVRRPGQHGTRAYVEQYGDRLVCVRYRYDEGTRRRYKTVEIIVEEGAWSRPSDRANDTGRQAVEPEAGRGGEVSLPHEAVARRAAAEPTGAAMQPASRQYEPSELVGVRLPPERPRLAR